MSNKYFINKKGSVSLFVVIFFSLLATVLVAGFVRVAVKEQQATLARNLSQSAYDASQAGIEDAKRVIIKLKDECTGVSNTACDTLRDNINSQECNKAPSLLNSTSPSTTEIEVKNTNYTYNQAYTCVTITNNTDDFLGSLNPDATKIIPLIGESPFTNVKLEWFTKSNTTDGSSLYLGTFSSNPSSLDSNSPPFLAVRFIQSPESGFSLTNLDSTDSFSRLFIKPSNGGNSSASSSSDPWNPIKSAPIEATCDSGFPNGYACSINLSLPSLKAVSLLEIKALYKNTDYRVSLYNSTSLVKFKGVQTKIDSTGRANDIFRRVETRLESASIDAYPTSAVEVEGNFCKNFSLTTVASNPFADCSP